MTPQKDGEKTKPEELENVKPGTSLSPTKKTEGPFPCHQCTSFFRTSPSHQHIARHLGIIMAPPVRMSNLIWQDLGIPLEQYQKRVKSDIQTVALFTHQLNLRVTR